MKHKRLWTLGILVACAALLGVGFASAAWFAAADDSPGRAADASEKAKDKKDKKDSKRNGKSNGKSNSKARRPSFKAGELEGEALAESSGIVASRRHAGVFWTHNDSGNPAAIYAVTGQGKLLATFNVSAKNEDWEDIAIDDRGRLYIGDIGNNGGRKTEVTVYRVNEPDPPDPKADGGGEAGAALRPPLRPNGVWRLRYPDDKGFDSEALFVLADHGYLISKRLDRGEAEVYRFDLKLQDKPAVLERVAALPIRSPVTAADVSADGRQLAVLTVTGPYLFQIDGDVTKVAGSTPKHVTFIHPNLEAACFTPDGVLATTETRQMYLFTWERFGADGGASPDAEPEGEDAGEKVELPIPRAKQVPTVDGDLAEWHDGTGSFALRCNPEAAAGDRPARLWACWDAAGVYLAAVVPDGKVTPLQGEWFAGDVVEVFVGRESAGRSPDYGDGDDRCYIGFAAGPDGSCGAAEICWPLRRDRPPAGAKAAGRIDPADGTYQVEVFIPAAALADGNELSAGGALRFNVSILSRDPKRNWFVSTSNESGTYLSPLKWAVATLAP